MPQLSRRVLLIHGGFLTALGALMCCAAVLGSRTGAGPFGFLQNNRVAAIGFIEAYGLAGLIGLGLILGAGTSPSWRWHTLGALVHGLLFMINISFWDLYAPMGLVFAGWASTIAHGLLIVLEGSFAIKTRRVAGIASQAALLP
jgi:hypothetical protein